MSQNWINLNALGSTLVFLLKLSQGISWAFFCCQVHLKLEACFGFEGGKCCKSLTMNFHQFPLTEPLFPVPLWNCTIVLFIVITCNGKHSVKFGRNNTKNYVSTICEWKECRSLFHFQNLREIKILGRNHKYRKIAKVSVHLLITLFIWIKYI